MEERPKINSQHPVVSQHSGDFERNRKEQIAGKRYFHPRSIFGMGGIMQVLLDNNKLNPEEDNPNLYDLHKAVSDPGLLALPGMKELVQKLKIQIKDKAKTNFAYAVVPFFMESYRDPELHSFVSPFIKRTPSLNLLETEDIPDEVFLQMVLKHAEEYVKKVEAFREREKKLRKEFLVKLQNLINDGILPVDFSRAVGHVNRFIVHLRDVLEQDLAELFGEVMPNEERVYISAELNEEMVRETYFHEMVHVIDGKSSVFLQGTQAREVEKESGLVKTSGVVISNRGGLNRGDGVKNSFFWLNEAVTDNIALMLLSQKNGTAYPQEKELLRQLMKRGQRTLSMKLLYKAYFEDTNEGDIHTVTPAMQEFINLVDEAYNAEGFLEKLDDFVTKHGVEKAIEVMKTDPKQICE